MSLGTNTLAPGDPAAAEPLVEDILADRYKKGQPIPGWDGHANRRLVDVLSQVWGEDVGY